MFNARNILSTTRSNVGFWQAVGSGGDSMGFSVDSNLRGDIVAVGSPGFAGGGGKVYVFRWNGAEWTNMGGSGLYDGAVLSTVGESFLGKSVSLSESGTVLAVGFDGRVKVYAWDGSTWTQRGGNFDGSDPFTTLGDYNDSISLSRDGNSLAVGDIIDDSDSPRGLTRVYDWSGSSWTQRGADIVGTIYAEGAAFVCLSGDGATLAVGAPFGSEERGKARVYRWSGTQWTPLGTQLSGEADGDRFGSSVSLNDNGTILAVGAQNSDGNGLNGCGSTSVYSWDGSSWSPRGAVIYGKTALEQSGNFVRLSSGGNVLAIGGGLGSTPKARVYSWGGSSWIQRGSDKTTNSISSVVGLSGDGEVFIVGEPYYSGGGAQNTGQGRLRIFARKDM
jgi:hypothetical protein